MKSILLPAAAALGLTGAAAADPGTLVIAGGALDEGNAEVFEAFIDAAGGPGARFAILPTASGYPAGSAASFAEALTAYGVDPANIVRVDLAIVNDPETETVNESAWAGNASDPDEIAKIEAADATWFTGGDQARITQALIEDDGRDTPMLSALRARLADGAVIGGTSAGAAMMSPVMIVRGETLPALLEAPMALADGTEAPETDRLVLGRGLGFFPYGITDQHFEQRARLGRLARAVLSAGEAPPLGFGVDENTALIADLSTHELTVIGEGAVTIVDARSAQTEPAGDALSVRGLLVHLLSGGDVLNIDTGAYAPAGYKSATVGSEYYDQPVVSGGGMAVSGDTLAAVLGDALLDNAASSAVERVSFSGDAGVVYRFQQIDASAGWWGRNEAGEAKFTAAAVRFDITPVRITVAPLSREAAQ